MCTGPLTSCWCREALLHSQVRFDLKGLDIINPEFEDAGILFSR